MNNMESEIWKDIPETEGNYQVSNLGKVKSIDRIIVKSNGFNCFLLSKKIKPAIDIKGYFRVCLSVDSKSKNFKVHRLVAQQFIPNPENKPQVNHIDGNKLNNHVSNLEWVTNQENIDHAIKLGLFKMAYTDDQKLGISENKFIKRGSDVGVSVLTSDQVLNIRSRFIPRVCGWKQLASEFGVSPLTIRDVISRKSWKHI